MMSVAKHDSWLGGISRLELNGSQGAQLIEMDLTRRKAPRQHHRFQVAFMLVLVAMHAPRKVSQLYLGDPLAQSRLIHYEIRPIAHIKTQSGRMHPLGRLVMHIDRSFILELSQHLKLKVEVFVSLYHF